MFKVISIDFRLTQRCFAIWRLHKQVSDLIDSCDVSTHAAIQKYDVNPMKRGVKTESL